MGVVLLTIYFVLDAVDAQAGRGREGKDKLIFCDKHEH